MKDLFDTKQQQIRGLFTSLTTPEAKYEKIIQLGKTLPDIDPSLKVEKNLVQGCQSQMYLVSALENNKVFFTAFSDALISSGLAYLLISAYNNQSPEIILKEPPHFLEDLGLFSLLSPIRSNGVKSLYLKMQQETVLLMHQFNNPQSRE